MRKQWILQNEGVLIQWRGPWVADTVHAIGDLVSHTKEDYGSYHLLYNCSYVVRRF